MNTIPNICRLTPHEEEILSARILKWNGLVRIFIHPLYEKWRGHEEKYLNNKHDRLTEIDTALSRMVSMPTDTTPPLIVFEEQRYSQPFTDWVLKRSGDGINCYLVETADSNPTPYGSVWKDTEWKKLEILFQKLGVKRILMAGIKLEILLNGERDWTKRSPYMGRCVGIALSYLSNRKAGVFDVELSALIHPKTERRALVDFYRNQS